MEELRKTWPDIKVLTRDIYNARKKHKTEKELAEAAGELPQPQPYQDPNGIIPGPDNRGRWAWIRDGEEILTKGKRKRRTVPPIQQDALDPQLQAAAQSSSDDQSAAAANRHLFESLQNGTGSYHAPDISLGASSSNNQNSWTNTNNTDSYDFVTPPPQLRAPAQSSSRNVPSTSNSAIPETQTPSGGSPMESRIAAMEKEQNETKQLLAKILGAVQGINPQNNRGT